jgi:hypothetical protein
MEAVMPLARIDVSKFDDAREDWSFGNGEMQYAPKLGFGEISVNFAGIVPTRHIATCMALSSIGEATKSATLRASA